MQDTTFRPSHLSPFSNDKRNPLLHRSRLVRLTRRAFVQYGEAVKLLVEARTALIFCPEEVEIALRRSRHFTRRYNKLEASLSKACGLERWQVQNDISTAFPIVPRLMANI
jgi:hypothetical protein